MSRRTLDALPPMWWMLIVGWLPIVLGIAVAASTVIHRPAALLNHALFLAGYMVTSVPLAWAYRRMFRRRMPAITAAALLFALSLVVSLLATIVLIAMAVKFGSVPGGFRWSAVFGSFDSLWFVLLAFCAMILLIGYYVSLKEERVRAIRATAMMREAELRALRYQLQPHFLFNTLNAISTLVVEHRNQQASRMIARLGDFLRATLEGGGSHEVPLAEELALTENYLDIEKARLGDRLDVSMRIGPGALRASVPWLLLQPLVENAIRHGISVRPDGGRLELHVGRADDRLCVDVYNDGIPGAATPDRDGNATSRSIGLNNLRERLARLYDDDHLLDIDVDDRGRCHVRIELPFRTAEAPAEDTVPNP